MKRIFLFSIFCFLFSISGEMVFAHGTSNVMPFRDPKSQIPDKIPFPYSQVENNVAVDFVFKVLPNDDEGFEDELSRFKLSFTNPQSQIRNPKSAIRNPKVGQDVALMFRVTDATMNWPIQGQGYVPDSPIRFVPGQGNLKNTRRLILKRAGLFGGHFPIDEYTYLFVLNTLDGTISVMDTSSSNTGKPIEKIMLCGDGIDCKGVDIDMEWLGRYAYVTLDSDQVAIIDCMRMCVVRRVSVGSRPGHVVVQPDGRFAWICNDGDGTVSVIDTESQNVIKTISVGKGHHEIAFTDDSRYACITNQGSDSVTLVDVFSLATVSTIPVGKQPHGLGYSGLSQFMYVANEGEGTVSVVDIWSKDVVNTISVGKGVRTVKFGPDSRYGFAPNKLDNTCSMIDVTKDVVSETFITGIEPDSVSFSPEWVFIRNTGSPDITAMSLGNMLLLKNIPIGNKIVNEVELPLDHVSMVPQGDGHSVLITSPASRAVYRYAPGEATAGGTVPTEIYNTQANGSSTLVVFYRGLKEVSSGVYLRVVRFARPGRYELGFYIDSPELTSCFELNVIK